MKLSNMSPGAKFLLYGAASVILIAGMKQASSLIVPFLMAVFIAIIFEPPIIWMQKRNIPFVFSLIIVVAFMAITAFLLGSIVGSSFKDFSDAMPVYEERVKLQIDALMNWLGEGELAFLKGEINGSFDPAIALKFASSLANGLSGVLANTLLILITVIFILMEVERFPAKLKMIVSAPDQSLSRFRNIAMSVNRYLMLKTLTSLLTGVLVTVGLLFIGVDFAIIWGVLAFCLNFIPNVGSIIAAVPAILLVWVQLGSLSVLWTSILYLFVNNFVGNYIEPKYMGKGLGLSPLVVFVSLIFWGWIFGPVGMFLSVPLTMAAKIIFESDDDSRWIAVLLDADATESSNEKSQIV